MPATLSTLAHTLVLGLSVVAPTTARADNPAPANGHIVVSTRGDTTIHFIDPDTLEVTARLPALVGLHEIAGSDDGLLALGAAYGSGPRHQTPDQRLQVIHLHDLNPATDDAPTLGPLIDLGPTHTRPNDIAFLPASHHALVTSEVSQSLLKVDLDATSPGAETSILATYPFGARAGHMLALAPDGSRAYVPSVADQTVSVIDLATGEVLAAPLAGPRAEGVASAPDNSAVWIACHGDHTIAILDPASLEITARFNAPGTPFRVRFTPDSAHAVVSFPSADLVRVYDARTREIALTIDLGPASAPTSVAVSPDGTRLAIVCAGDDTLAVADLSTGDVLARLSLGPTPDGLTWAPAPTNPASGSSPD